MRKAHKKTGRPLVLTVKGKAVADQLDAIASIRRGLAQAKKGLGRPVDEVFDELQGES